MIKTSFIYPIITAAIILLLASGCKKEKPASLPIFASLSIQAVSSDYADFKSNVSSDGGAALTARGLCWSSSSLPSTSDSKIAGNNGTGTNTNRIPGLTPGAAYHVRAYATNAVGTSYSEDVTFSTKAILGVITTSPVSGVTASTAVSGGNIKSDGGGLITARGVCWSTTTNPVTTDLKTTDGSITGSFTSTLTGLMPGTTYHVRAYITNSLGTSYGSDISFTTLTVAPSLTTNSITAITSSSATCGGNIASDGGAAITSRGVCWSTAADPATSGAKTTDGSGTGIFTSNMTGLTAGTTYHIRAYAINSSGIAYGTEFTFTTLVALPTLNTTASSDITAKTATSGGNITSDGGAAIIARGVCWSTANNPSVADSKTTDGNGTGSFISNIIALNGNTTYFLRSYATNSAGTAYGDEISFTTALIIDYPNGNDAYWIEASNGFRDVSVGNGDLVFKYDMQNKQYVSGNSILIPNKVSTPNGDVIDKTNFYGFSGSTPDNSKYQWDGQKNSVITDPASPFDKTNMFVSPISAGTMTYAQAINVNSTQICTSSSNSNVLIEGDPQTLLYPDKTPTTGTFNLWNGEELVYEGALKNSISTFGASKDEYSSQQQLTVTNNQSYCVSTYGQGWRLPTDIEVGHTTNAYNPGLVTTIDYGYRGASGQIFTSSRFYYPGYAFYKWYVALSTAGGNWNNIDQWNKTKYQVRCVYGGR